MLYRYAGLMGDDTALSENLEAGDSALAPDPPNRPCPMGGGRGVFSGLAGFSCPGQRLLGASSPRPWCVFWPMARPRAWPAKSPPAASEPLQRQPTIMKKSRRWTPPRASGAVGVQVAVVEGGAVTGTYAGAGPPATSSVPMTTPAAPLSHPNTATSMTADHKLRVASLSKVALAMGGHVP